MNNFHRDKVEHSFKMDVKDWLKIKLAKNTAVYI